MIQFETQRLVIRDHQISDLNDFHHWISDSDIMRFVGFPKTKSYEESFIKLSEAINENLSNNRKKYFFAVVEKNSGKIIGECGLTIEARNDDSGIGEIGYFLFKEFWKSGFGTEIAHALIDFGFKELKLHKIIAKCDSDNLYSEKVMVKSGMAKEGEFKKQRFDGNMWKNEVSYAILNQ